MTDDALRSERTAATLRILRRIYVPRVRSRASAPIKWCFSGSSAGLTTADLRRSVPSNCRRNRDKDASHGLEAFSADFKCKWNLVLGKLAGIRLGGLCSKRHS